MAIGDTALFGYNSVLGIEEETAYGTKAAATAASFIEFNSESLKHSFEIKALESITQSRDYSRAVMLNETNEGSIEANLNPMVDSQVFLIKQAMGGYVTTATIVAAALRHTIYTGDMETTKATTTSSDVKSLSIWADKGGRRWEFLGARVNQLSIKGEVGGPVVMTAEIIAKAGTVSTDSLTCVIVDSPPALFHGVTIKFADNVASVTASGTAETFQAFEFTLNNNLVADAAARALGSRQLSICPPTRRDVGIKLTQRFDTVTAYNRFTNLTTMAMEIILDTGFSIGSAGGGSSSCLVIRMGRVQFTGSMPEVGEAGVLQQEIEGICLQANTSTTYTLRMDLHNATANYA